jgi:hypothetical protein
VTPDKVYKLYLDVCCLNRPYSVQLEQSEVIRAKQLQTLGFKQWDALHLACAESGQVDVLLTTDDKLLSLAHRVSDQLKLKVDNPLRWLTEITK